jgi:hypothetical protein
LLLVQELSKNVKLLLLEKGSCKDEREKECG